MAGRTRSASLLVVAAATLWSGAAWAEKASDTLRVVWRDAIIDKVNKLARQDKTVWRLLTRSRLCSKLRALKLPDSVLARLAVKPGDQTFHLA